ncbi:heavy metal-associated isoprenylated plant protein 16-like [Miscanthus floridulus]|uniref:heavy metal-associated isoprenylated plant protein 16-like n=1 Tax=Miscanthus floridulus TaxID=154761 RepID=UPI00345885EC
MRKEIIIRIHVKSDKCQAKAMKVAAAGSGVESVTLAGGDKSLLLVIGDGVDSNKLLKKLKKKVGEAEIVELRTHDTFEAAALPLPGTKQELAAMMAMAAARSPYNNQHQQWQHSYAAAPTSPYSYHYYPSPVGGYGYGYGYGAGGAAVSSYSRAVARSHPANYSPMVERHDYQPMEHSSSSSSGKRRETMAVPRHGSGTNSCTIL